MSKMVFGEWRGETYDRFTIDHARRENGTVCRINTQRFKVQYAPIDRTDMVTCKRCRAILKNENSKYAIA